MSLRSMQTSPKGPANIHGWALHCMRMHCMLRCDRRLTGAVGAGTGVKSAGVVYEVDPSVGRVGQAVRA